MKGVGAMGREKEGYREILSALMERYPLLMSKTQAARALGIGKDRLAVIIRKKHIAVQDGKIPIGSLASYLCGI